MANIDPVLLERVRVIVCHRDCPDGLASAMILKHALPHAQVRFVQYGPELEALQPEPGMLFCDIAPVGTHQDGDRIGAHIDLGTIVLDHHKTARATVVDLFAPRGLGVFADEKEEPGVSGAVLAFRHVWQPLREHLRGEHAVALQVEKFAELVGIRDTWQTASPRWARACDQARALMFYGPDVLLEGLHAPWLDESEMQVGRLVRERHDRRAREIAVTGLVRLGAVGMFNDAPAADGQRLISDVAEALRLTRIDAESVPRVIAGYFFHRDGETGGHRFTCSLRAVDETIDVAAIAKASGGGGHSKAAGFSVRADDAEATPEQLVWRAFRAAGRDELVEESD